MNLNVLLLNFFTFRKFIISISNFLAFTISIRLFTVYVYCVCVCMKCECVQCLYVNTILQLIRIYLPIYICVCVCFYCLWIKLKNKSSSLIITWLITFYEITVKTIRRCLISINSGSSASVSVCVCNLYGVLQSWNIQIYSIHLFINRMAYNMSNTILLTEPVTCIVSI